MTGEELRRALDPYIDDCLSDDPQTSREALHAYLDYVFSFVHSNADLPDRMFDPFHRLVTALGDMNHADSVRLFAPIKKGNRRATLHQNVVYAAAAAMVTVRIRELKEDLNQASRQTLKFMKALEFEPLRGRSDADDHRTDTDRLIKFRKKCSSTKSEWPEASVKNEYRLMSEFSLAFVEGRLRQLRRWQP